MGKTRNATLSITTSYQNAGALVAAISGAFTATQFEDGFFRTLATASYPVRVSIVRDGATTGADGLSNLLAAGEYLPFEWTDLNYVWLKSVGGSSTIEFSGSEAD